MPASLAHTLPGGACLPPSLLLVNSLSLLSFFGVVGVLLGVFYCVYINQDETTQLAQILECAGPLFRILHRLFFLLSKE